MESGAGHPTGMILLGVNVKTWVVDVFIIPEGAMPQAHISPLATRGKRAS